SQLQHAGMGLHGGYLNPDGDLEEMQKLNCLLADEALVFVGVPFGHDAVIWNTHRIYGMWRIPLLFADYQFLGIYSGAQILDKLENLNRIPDGYPEKYIAILKKVRQSKSTASTL